MLIRPETPEDHAAIAEVNRAAFRGPLEAMLVERLRSDGLLIVSLVAVDQAGKIVGHILFSIATMVTTEGDRIPVASLAPMAVLPSDQRRGIGGRLVERGLEACRQARHRAVIVVGHPNYYPRFGFSHSVVSRLTNPFATDDAFMGLELVSGSLSGLEGRVVYPDAFELFA